ncbi:IS1595 family transposase [Methyloglobulus sp.]|uniref:IS1595 family transposase n=1 Tax=Methyloglobulus sp. TaxID=2518622 RepID=UPI00398A4E02
MSMNRVQFQPSLSMPDFIGQYGTEAQCEAALTQVRWPEGFRCPGCGHGGHCVLHNKGRKTFQCNACHRQTSLIAGTLCQGTNLPLTTWFLAIYLVSQAKTGLSALALKRYLGVGYPSAWLMRHKLMQAMAEREDHYLLSGQVQLDDAYLGGERNGGKAGRGSENKVPFVAAVSVDSEGHPGRVKLTPVSGFSTEAIETWPKSHLSPGCMVRSDGLACFGGVSAAGCQHLPLVVGGRKPNGLPEFRWVNTVLGNVKTSLCGAYHGFAFSKYAHRYLAEIAYRFNRRFRLKTLPERLLVAAVAIGPRPEAWLRLAEDSC